VTELKSKWRNLKDTFHREAKRVEISQTDDINQPIIKYYTGQWAHFERLLFLWNPSRHLAKSVQEEVFIQIDGPSIQTEDIKGETNITDSEDGEFEAGYQDTDDGASNTALREILANDSINSQFKRSYNDTDVPEKRKRCDMNCGIIEDSEGDEDLHFAKSLVPFMKKLNPIRKLIVRNEIHSLLLKELLCERCKSIGPQPNCRCNL
jgi:hypothetical protein